MSKDYYLHNRGLSIADLKQNDNLTNINIFNLFF